MRACTKGAVANAGNTISTIFSTAALDATTIIYYDRNVMNELPSAHHFTPTRVRRKALADWFMETSSLVLVFLVGEPALRRFIHPRDETSMPISIWYYALVVFLFITTFTVGMRLHRDP